MHEEYSSPDSIVDETIEECAELIKALCKAKRFGWYNYNPKDPNKVTNLN